MKRISIIILWILPIFFIGCSTARTYKEVFEQEPIYNSRKFSVASDTLYQATMSTICSKNFIIEKESKDEGLILGKRSFQKGKKTIIVTLQAKISSDEEDGSILYLNALQTTYISYIADRTRFFLWIIPLPGGGGREASEFKQEERIIENAKFYQDFFSIIQNKINILGEKRASQKLEIKIVEETVKPKEERLEAKGDEGGLKEEDIELEENKGVSEDTEAALEGNDVISEEASEGIEEIESEPEEEEVQSGVTEIQNE
jgi:NACalpha-BTF3-like transcription factor